MKIDNATKQLLTQPDKQRTKNKKQKTQQKRTQTQIADDAGVSRQCLYQVFNRTYPRMEKVITDTQSLAPKELWPERYDADGLPIYQKKHPKKTATKQVKNTTRVKGRNVN